MTKFTAINRSGDTIVEVLIALSILGLAISISYATASRSLTSIRLAHETSIASNIAKSQVELLRNANASTLPDPANPFCFDMNNMPSTDMVNGSCTQSIYSIKITNPTSNQYKTEVTWQSSGSYILNMWYYK